MNPQFLNAEELGIRLEIIGKLPVWEASPIYKHQKAVDRIRQSFVRDENAACACLHIADVYVSFPDGSLKRPDISVFGEEPAEEEEAIKQIPAAIIEVISKNYEIKDLELAPPVYLANGVKDVIVFNPYTKEVRHITPDAVQDLTSPARITLACGCACIV